MRAIILLAILFLLFSCRPYQADNEYSGSSKFDSHTDTLYGEYLPAKVISKGGANKVFISPYGLLTTADISRNILQIRDTASGKILKAQYNMGKGPEELIDYLGKGFNPDNNSFCVWDLGKRCINLYRVSDDGLSLIRSNRYSGFSINDVVNISDTTDMIITAIPNQQLLIYGNNGIIDLAPFGILDEPDLDYANNYFSCDIGVSRRDQILFVVGNSIPYLAAYSYANNKLVKLWDMMLLEFSYILRNNWWIAYKNTNIGFRDMSVTDNYIYLTHYELNYEEYYYNDKDKKMKEITLMVYDFKGNLIKTSLLDHNVSSISITPDDKTLYGITYEKGDHIIKYKLKP